MYKLSKILGFVALFFILVSTLTVTFGFLLIGAAVVGLFGVYRYYLAKKIARNSKKRPRSNGGYSSGEIIDMPVEDKEK